MSTYDPDDRAHELLESADADAEEIPDEPVTALPLEAPEADTLEQAVEVPVDDEDDER